MGSKEETTNRSRLEAMTDVELAEVFCDWLWMGCAKCPGRKLCVLGEGTANGLVKWLGLPPEEKA